MKRLKILAGMTTILLAVAGIAATRYYGPATMRFYITYNGNYCKAVGSICTTGGVNRCYYTVNGVIFGATRYPLYTRGPEWYYLPGINCTSPLQYTESE